MIRYILTWVIVTLFKLFILTGCIIGAVGGVLCFDEYALLAIVFIPSSLFYIYDVFWQLMVPFWGGKGHRYHKPLDTPIYMGLAPSYKEAKKAILEGKAIIWD